MFPPPRCSASTCGVRVVPTTTTKPPLAENRRVKPLRVHLFEVVVDFLNAINVNYFIYGGTALSVYREGKNMIEHDGDIDVAILEADFLRVIHNISSFKSVADGYAFMFVPRVEGPGLLQTRRKSLTTEQEENY